MRLRKFGKIGIITVAIGALSINTFAQDLIAKRAPIDKTLKKVDSLALLNLMKIEPRTNYASADLYPDWDTVRVHSSNDKLTLLDTYFIDLTGFCMPAKLTDRITSPFGPRRRRMHNGTDIKVYVGDTIVAAFDGKVRIVRTERRGYGKYVVIRHYNGLETIYGHLSQQLVEENQEVRAGEVIGLGGNTGRSTGSHLHFETRFLGIAINPAELFDFQKQDVTSDTYVFTKHNHEGKNASAMAKSRAKNTGKANSDVIRYHKVKNGDTLSQIAAAYGISISQLCQLNKITRGTTIRAGQVLRCS
jgi:murein DD-endopeptidase MepM/ murein hydrolase activator NlpD